MSKLRQIPFGDVVHFKKGINYTSNDYGNEDNGVPFITIKCFKKGGGYEKNGLKYFKGVFNESDTLVKGQVLFSVTDLTRAGDIVGSPLKVPDFGKSRISLASMDLMKIEPKDGECINEYIYYCLMSDDIRRKMVAFSAGSTVLHLDIKRVPEFIVPIPKISFQRKIARILSTVDAVIDKTEAAIDKYKNIKAGMIHDLFTRGIDLATGKLRPSYEEAPDLYKQSELGMVPKKWEVVKINQVSTLVTNGFVGVATPYYETSDYGVRYLYGTNIRQNEITFDDIRYVSRAFHQKQSKSQLKTGDMLTVQSGHIGTTAIIPEYFGDVNCHALIITRFILSKIFPWFVSYYINSDLGMKGLQKLFIGSTIKHINTSELATHYILKPKVEEQKAISKKIDSIENILNKEHLKLKKTHDLKQALMSDLLTGKVRVKYEKEKEEAL